MYIYIYIIIYWIGCLTTNLGIQKNSTSANSMVDFQVNGCSLQPLDRGAWHIKPDEYWVLQKIGI